MTHQRKLHTPLTAILLITAALACNLPNSNPNEQETISDGGNEQTREESSDSQKSPEPSQPPTAATMTPRPPIEHIDRPSNPAAVNSFVIDRSTKGMAAERRAESDSFTNNRLERPYTAETMDYLDHLDLTRGEMSSNPPWIYTTIFLEGAPPEDSEAIYAVELDLDIDGRGDWLIFGRAPAGIDWTTDGVHVYRDANNDVGGRSPILSEGSNSVWDGYEDHVFDEGYGSDPDAAWIRRVPNHPDRIQIAFKVSLISDSEFLWGVWADEGIREPAYFDYNDHFDIDEAGSPLINDEHYPLKGLFAVDNTCRWGFGFEPIGNELGVCYVPPTPTPTLLPTPTFTPTATPSPGSISGGAFQDIVPGAGNGQRDPGDPAFPAIRINLYSGACNSSNLLEWTSTAVNGAYTFSGLSAGTYCVEEDYNGCDYKLTTPGSYTVYLDPGEDVNLNWFGYRIWSC